MLVVHFNSFNIFCMEIDTSLPMPTKLDHSSTRTRSNS